MQARRSFTRRLVEHAAVLGAILAVTLGASGTALAQTPPSTDQGPRFNQWGPGQPAPDAEGPAGSDVPGPAPRAPSPGAAPDQNPGGRSMAPDTGPSMAPAPSAPFPSPPGALVPGPAPERWGGCNYDLRGGWTVFGRQTDPYDYSYSAYIYVRQFRGWLQIDQPDDGLSYYGRCRGDQLELDVYAGSSFIGYEDGLVSWGNQGWSRGRGARVRANWVSFSSGYNAGWETWQRW
jgi:hypothetical protein